MVIALPFKFWQIVETFRFKPSKHERKLAGRGIHFNPKFWAYDQSPQAVKNGKQPQTTEHTINQSILGLIIMDQQSQD